MNRVAQGYGDGASTIRGACPGHRHGLRVMIVETHSRRPRCTASAECNLQAGHPGACEWHLHDDELREALRTTPTGAK